MTTAPTIETTRTRVDEAVDETVDETRSTAGQVRDAVGGALDHVPDLIETARASAEQVVEHAPEAIERAKAGTQRTTTSLQAMPDATLRMLAGVSVGLAAGLGLAGAPRLVVLAALAPSLLVGGAIATRPGSRPLAK
jgi:ABC-type transporter Mla subunit MlaD